MASSLPISGTKTENCLLTLPSVKLAQQPTCLKERAAIIGAIFGTVSIAGAAAATLVLSAMQQITTLAATALIAKCLGLAVLGAMGGLVVYGIPLIVLIAAMVALGRKNNNKKLLLDEISLHLFKGKCQKLK